MISDHGACRGLRYTVRAQPEARRNGVQGEQDGALKIAVTAPPEDGRANAALVEVLRDALGLKRSQIELLSGQTSREKKVSPARACRERSWNACSRPCYNNRSITASARYFPLRVKHTPSPLSASRPCSTSDGIFSPAIALRPYPVCT